MRAQGKEDLHTLLVRVSIAMATGNQYGGFSSKWYHITHPYCSGYGPETA